MDIENNNVLNAIGKLLLIVGAIFLLISVMSNSVVFYGRLENVVQTGARTGERIIGIVFIDQEEIYRDYLTKRQTEDYMLVVPNYFGYSVEIETLASNISKNWGTTEIGKPISFYAPDQTTIQLLTLRESELPSCRKIHLSPSTIYQCSEDKTGNQILGLTKISSINVLTAVLSVTGVILLIMSKIKPPSSTSQSRFSPSSLLGAVISFAILVIVVVVTLTWAASQLPLPGTIITFIFTLALLLLLIPTILLLFDLISAEQLMEIFKAIEKKIPIFNASFITSIFRSVGLINNKQNNNDKSQE